MNPDQNNNQNQNPPAGQPESAGGAADDGNSLEGTGTIVEASQAADEASKNTEGGAVDASGGKTPKAKLPGRGPLASLKRGFNIYILMFFGVILVAVIIIAFAVHSASDQASKDGKVNSQTVSDDTLKQLANSDVTVGDPKSVLNVQSNAVFAGKVLVRDNLEVAGSISVSGALSLSGLTVSGTTKTQELQVSGKLGVAQDAIFQGSLSVQKTLAVTGTGTFGGTLTAPTVATSNLQLNNDLTLTHHIIVGGGNPGRSNGAALGSGGSATVSGSDTGGTINVNVGSSPAAGCFINVTFTQRYNGTPHVLITPVGSDAGGLPYYVNRSTTGFSVCVSQPPSPGTSFSFDYFVVG